MSHCFKFFLLYITTITIIACSIYFTYNYSLAIMLTTEIFKPQLFCSHATSHKANWILTYSLFCSQRRFSNHNCFVHTQLHTRLTEFLLFVARFVLPFLYAQVISLMKVVEVKRLELHLHENSIAIAFLFWYCVHNACSHTCLSLFLSYNSMLLVYL